MKNKNTSVDHECTCLPQAAPFSLWSSPPPPWPIHFYGPPASNLKKTSVLWCKENLCPRNLIWDSPSKEIQSNSGRNLICPGIFSWPSPSFGRWWSKRVPYIHLSLAVSIQMHFGDCTKYSCYIEEKRWQPLSTDNKLCRWLKLNTGHLFCVFPLKSCKKVHFFWQTANLSGRERGNVKKEV